MSDEKKIASCSFGKDSLAAIIVSEENGVHVDEALYCRIMFNDKISAELPEHEEFIHETAIPLLESRYGMQEGGAPLSGIYKGAHAARLLVLPQSKDKRIEEAQKRAPGIMGGTACT